MLSMYGLIFMTAGFVSLLLGAGWLVDGASSLARRWKISDLVIGLTVVAFGTSLPELFVNLTASIKGDAGIALGNVIGSNIVNVFLILGISSLIYPLSVGRGTVWKEIPMGLLSAVLLGFLANDRLSGGASVLSRVDGFILMLFFAGFLYYSARIARQGGGVDGTAPVKVYGTVRSVLMIIAGLAALAAGSQGVVDGALRIAVSAGLSTTFLGLSIVAVGTSLPELATSAVAAFQHKPEIAVGNVVGSNIFNIFFILGVSALLRPIPLAGNFNADIAVLIAANVFLFVFMFTGGKRRLDRWEGALLAGCYICYLLFIMRRG